METVDEQALQQEDEIVADHVKLQMMQHMADGLEDEAAGLGCRAEGIEEEEFLLARTIDEHYTEINRLVLKLQGLRSQRYDLLEKIDRLRSEASVLRERIWTGEDELALSALASADAPPNGNASLDDAIDDDIRSETCYEGKVGERGLPLQQSGGPVFFRQLRATNPVVRARLAASRLRDSELQAAAS